MSELHLVQNPAFCALLLRRVVQGFQNQASNGPELPFAFLSLPLLLHRPTLEIASRTLASSGLSLFASKLGTKREELLAIHERALVLRRLTLQSIGVATSTRMLTLDAATTRLVAPPLMAGEKEPALPERLKLYRKTPEKIGVWFAASGLATSAQLLQVQL